MENAIMLEQILAGALLKFGKLDNVDLSLILDDFMADYTGEVNTHYSLQQLRRYMSFDKNGTISINDKMPLHFFIEEESKTVKEKYEEVAGKIVLDYFDKVNVEDFYVKKDDILKTRSAALKNSANVLLISDIEEEYTSLKEYGFRKVDCFKSIIRAEKYFEMHPEELEKYHIILIGNQSVTSFESRSKLEVTIQKLNWEKGILTTPISRYNFSDHSEFVAYLGNCEIGRDWETEENSYSDLFDRIVECAIINHILDKVDIKEDDFKPIKDYINPNRLPLPMKKKDVKILFLDAIKVDESANDIAAKLGLNVTFHEDGNSSLGKYVKYYLGDYDIIIASGMYSRNILNMNNECTEQGKDSGRDLTLLVTYDDDRVGYFDEDGVYDYDGFGDKVILNYIFGGEFADNYVRQNKEFRVLRQPFATNCPSNFIKYNQSRKSKIQAILESSVNLYNNYLLQTRKTQLTDLDLKSAEQYDTEFASVEEIEKQRQEQLLGPIKVFDSLRYQIENYVKYKKLGLADSDLEGIRIEETPEGICVENVLDGRTLCSITFPRECKKGNLRIFTIQTLTNKGKLGTPEMVGLYTRKYESLETVPNRVDERQMKAVLATKKKVDTLIEPLNREVQEKRAVLCKRKITKLNKSN